MCKLYGTQPPRVLWHFRSNQFEVYSVCFDIRLEVVRIDRPWQSSHGSDWLSRHHQSSSCGVCAVRSLYSCTENRIALENRRKDPQIKCLAAVVLVMAQMTESDIYRTSTQYQVLCSTWEVLATTNVSTVDGVKVAIEGQHASRAGSDSAKEEKNDQISKPSKDLDCLTVDEKQKLVGARCNLPSRMQFPCKNSISLHNAKALFKHLLFRIHYPGSTACFGGSNCARP